MRRLAVLLLVLGLTACSGSDEPDAAPTPSAAPSSTAPPPRATPAPVPATKTCHALSYDEAVAPTAAGGPVSCAKKHTSVTYAVGALDTLVDGHLLAVDSDRVQQAVADTCRRRFAAYVGGTSEERRLSLLRPVWFTPSLREADRGADWLRCDVVALSGDAELAPLTASPKGKPASYALCGTAQPGTEDFHRVLCRDEHAWKAVSTVDLAGRSYPGEQAARSKASGPCQQAGADNADDPLNYQWGSEVPTREQWEAGITWATCWVPD